MSDLDFWGYSVLDIIKMNYEGLAPAIVRASGLSEKELIAAVTGRRMGSGNDAEILACSRILSAVLGGPDLIT